jgi:serine/threonine-protein kinase
VIELAANLRDVGFSVRSVPPGAAVWVDGELSAAVTPAKLTGIKPGIHRLALKHEGYSDYELQMFVPEATVLQLPAAELVALPAAPVEPVRPSRRSRRALSADDAEPYSARRTRRAEASESSSRAERTSYTSSYGTRRSRAADSEAEASPRAAAAAESGKTGTLRLNSRPWAQVTLDGKPIGNTPQQNLQLSAGKHKLQLSNPQLGLAKSVTINIKAGETQTQVVNLAE